MSRLAPFIAEALVTDFDSSLASCMYEKSIIFLLREFKTTMMRKNFRKLLQFCYLKLVNYAGHLIQ
jgi:hypothetical protein